MPYVLSIERIAHQEGRQEGRRAEAIAFLTRQLTKKFGPLSPEQQDYLANASLEALEIFGEHLLDATSLEGVWGDSPL